MDLKNDFYNIKDLYVVRLDDAYVKKSRNEYIHYYNSDLKFIVEKISIEKGGELPYYVEFYTECITELDLVKRSSKRQFKSIPKEFYYIEELPLEYLTEEEVQSGKISTMRLFQIFQEINMKRKKFVKAKKKNKLN